MKLCGLKWILALFVPVKLLLLRWACRLNKTSFSPHILPAFPDFDLRETRSVWPEVCTSTTISEAPHTIFHCRHLMNMPSRDSAFSKGCPVICVVSHVFWFAARSSRRYFLSDWGTFNGGQITDGVWMKTAFKSSTVHFPWLLLIRNESSSAGRRWECWGLSVYVFQMLSRACISEFLSVTKAGSIGRREGTQPREHIVAFILSLCPGKF